MLTSLRWLALEVKHVEPAREFYEGALDLPVAAASEREVSYAVGDQRLVLRRPRETPRGGVHTHYAFSTPPDRYDDWRDRLSGAFDLREHSFGAATSLYLYDPDGNCVEIGDVGDGDGDLSGIFEVVLEVEDLARAESFYADLGFEAVDRGSDRRRVRLAGPVDLELWEPQLGIAEARGGVHVDVGFGADDPDRAADAVADRACRREDLDGGVRVKDPDGHWLTFRG